MSENDFRKQLLLNEFKTLSKGKNKEEILPLIFALSQKAKQAGIQFTRQDCELIYKQIVPGGNPPEGWSGIPLNGDLILLSYWNGIRTTISRGWRHRDSAPFTKTLPLCCHPRLIVWYALYSIFYITYLLIIFSLFQIYNNINFKFPVFIWFNHWAIIFINDSFYTIQTIAMIILIILFTYDMSINLVYTAII